MDGFIKIVSAAQNRSALPRTYAEWEKLKKIAIPILDRLRLIYSIDLDAIDRRSYKSWRPENHVTQPLLDQMSMIWNALPPGLVFDLDPSIELFFILYSTRYLVYRHQRETPNATIENLSRKTGLPIPVQYEPEIEDARTKTRDSRDRSADDLRRAEGVGPSEGGGGEVAPPKTKRSGRKRKSKRVGKGSLPKENDDLPHAADEHDLQSGQ